MASWICALMLVAGPPGLQAAPDAVAEIGIEEEVDFGEEEEVDFADEQPVARVSLPEVEVQSWLLALPIGLLALLAWNVGWRSARRRRRRSATPD